MAAGTVEAEGGPLAPCPGETTSMVAGHGLSEDLHECGAWQSNLEMLSAKEIRRRPSPVDVMDGLHFVNSERLPKEPKFITTRRGPETRAKLHTDQASGYLINLHRAHDEGKVQVLQIDVAKNSVYLGCPWLSIIQTGIKVEDQRCMFAASGNEGRL